MQVNDGARCVACEGFLDVTADGRDQPWRSSGLLCPDCRVWSTDDVVPDLRALFGSRDERAIDVS